MHLRVSIKVTNPLDITNKGSMIGGFKREVGKCLRCVSLVLVDIPKIIIVLPVRSLDELFNSRQRLSRSVYQGNKPSLNKVNFLRGSISVVRVGKLFTVNLHF